MRLEFSRRSIAGSLSKAIGSPLLDNSFLQDPSVRPPAPRWLEHDNRFLLLGRPKFFPRCLHRSPNPCVALSLPFWIWEECLKKTKSIRIEADRVSLHGTFEKMRLAQPERRGTSSRPFPARRGLERSGDECPRQRGFRKSPCGPTIPLTMRVCSLLVGGWAGTAGRSLGPVESACSRAKIWELGSSRQTSHPVLICLQPCPHAQRVSQR